MSKEKLKKYTVSTIFPNEEIMNDALNRKSADEMFKELGYEKQQEEMQDEIDSVIYQKRYEKDGFEYLKKIEINNPKIYSYPFIRVIKIFILVEKYDEVDISIEELQAINEKCKELRLAWKKMCLLWKSNN